MNVNPFWFLGTGKNINRFHPGLSRILAFVILTGIFAGQAQAQDVLGGLTLGLFLNKALDQVDQSIKDAQNAGNATAIEAGREAALAIQNAQNAYSDSLDKTAKDLDKATLSTVNQITGLTDDVSNKVNMTVDNATSRVQQITDSLPFANTEPQVTSITPPYIVPKDGAASNNLEIIFKGNFPNSSLQGYAPYLKIGGQIFKSLNTTQSLKFLVPQGTLFKATAPRANGIQLAEATLIVPWQQPEFLGLFHSEKDDTYNVAIGSLPASPGAITVLHTTSASIPVFKNFCSTGIHQASTREAGNNDDKDHHWMIPAENGWNVVRNTSSAKVNNSQGDVGLPSFISDDANRVVYTATTIHHGAGSSGSLDFQICFKETQNQPTTNVDTQKVAMKWGDTRDFPFVDGTWEVTFVDFTGKRTDYRGPDGSNPFISVAEPSGKLQIRATDPDRLTNWP